MTCYGLDSQSGGSLLLQQIPLASSRAIAFKGDTLFAGSNLSKFYRINLAANSVTQIGSLPNNNYYGLAVHPGSGQLYAAAQSTSSAAKEKIFIINTATGDTVSVGATGDHSITQAIAFAPSGILYGLKTGWTGNTLVTIDPKTGAATPVRATGVSGLRGFVIGPHTTAVKAQRNNPEMPEHFTLLQNYPNPFNASTTIEFTLSAPGQVSLMVYSILGQKMVKLVQEELPTGNHRVIWNADHFANGIYYYVLQTGDYREIRKAILMK